MIARVKILHLVCSFVTSLSIETLNFWVL